MEMVKNDDRPLKIINTFENKSAAVIRLSNFDNTFLYVLKYFDKNISNYLIESEEAQLKSNLNEIIKSLLDKLEEADDSASKNEPLSDNDGQDDDQKS